MKPRLLFFRAVLVAGGTSIALAQTQTDFPLPPSDDEAPRPKVAIMQAVVSIDGEVRADLGRAVSDGLIAGFLRHGAVDVIDVENRTTPDGRAMSPVEAGREATCERVFVPTVVGQGEAYRITVRELVVPSGKVEQVWEQTATGPLPQMLAMVGRLVEHFVPAAPAPPPRVGPIYGHLSGPGDADAGAAQIPAAGPPDGGIRSVPPPLSPSRSAIPKSVPPPEPAPLRQVVLTGEQRLEIEEIGRVTAVNMTYSFCVIHTTGRKLRPGDRILLKVDGWRRPTLTATVARCENRHAVVEFTVDGDPPALDVGAPAYEWVPEAETDPTPGLPSVPAPIPFQ